MFSSQKGFEDKMRVLFREYSNQDGSIDMKELKTLMMDFDPRCPAPSESEVVLFMRRADRSGENLLQEDEFVSFMSRQKVSRDII